MLSGCVSWTIDTCTSVAGPDAVDITHQPAHVTNFGTFGVAIMSSLFLGTKPAAKNEFAMQRLRICRPLSRPIRGDDGDNSKTMCGLVIDRGKAFWAHSTCCWAVTTAVYRLEYMYFWGRRRIMRRMSYHTSRTKIFN